MMRKFGAGLLAAVCAATLGMPLAAPPALAQNAAQDPAHACPGNPNALGTSRVIAIDPGEYKHVGRMQYPDSLPLADKEVVITFDDGPLPPYSNQILDILASECVKATYFLVGSMARAYPATVRRIYEEGHTIGTHSLFHPSHFSRLPVEKLRREIDGGIAEVSAALGDSKYLAPFFRIPGLDRSELVESELAARSLVVFSSDTVADDWHHGIKPNQIAALALQRLQARGKGILLLHDIHPKTVAALPGLLKSLKDGGFHIVQVVPSASYMIAMAAKPQASMLASATPEHLVIGHGIDGGSVQPAWPESTADVGAAEIALPAPDAADFEPDSGVADLNRDVHWPDQPEAKSVAADPRAPAAGGKKAEEKARSSADAASPNDREKLRADHVHVHRHNRARAGNDDQDTDVVSRIKAFAALFSAPQTAH